MHHYWDIGFLYKEPSIVFDHRDVNTAPCDMKAIYQEQYGSTNTLFSLKVSRKLFSSPITDNTDIISWKYGYSASQKSNLLIYHSKEYINFAQKLSSQPNDIRISGGASVGAHAPVFVETPQEIIVQPELRTTGTLIKSQHQYKLSLGILQRDSKGSSRSGLVDVWWPRRSTVGNYFHLQPLSSCMLIKWKIRFPVWYLMALL